MQLYEHFLRCVGDFVMYNEPNELFLRFFIFILLQSFLLKLWFIHDENILSYCEFSKLQLSIKISAELISNRTAELVR